MRENRLSPTSLSPTAFADVHGGVVVPGQRDEGGQARLLGGINLRLVAEDDDLAAQLRHHLLLRHVQQVVAGTGLVQRADFGVQLAAVDDDNPAAVLQPGQQRPGIRLQGVKRLGMLGAQALVLSQFYECPGLVFLVTLLDFLGQQGGKIQPAPYLGQQHLQTLQSAGVIYGHD